MSQEVPPRPGTCHQISEQFLVIDTNKDFHNVDRVSIKDSTFKNSTIGVDSNVSKKQISLSASQELIHNSFEAKGFVYDLPIKDDHVVNPHISIDKGLLKNSHAVFSENLEIDSNTYFSLSYSHNSKHNLIVRKYTSETMAKRT